MKVIVQGRRSGKSTAAIFESAKTGKYILVDSKIQADCIFKLANELGVSIPFPITVYELLNGGVANRVKREGLIVDEAMWILQKVLDTRIHMATINKVDGDEKDMINNDPETKTYDPLELVDKVKANDGNLTDLIEKYHNLNYAVEVSVAEHRKGDVGFFVTPKIIYELSIYKKLEEENG